MKSDKFLKVVFLTLVLINFSVWAPPRRGTDGGQKPPDENSAGGKKHQACMTKRGDAMTGITGFSSQKPWPIMRMHFALNNLKMMASIPEEFLCHMKAEMGDSLSTLPVSVTKSMTPGGASGTALSITMTLDKASSDSNYDGKGYDYAASVKVNDATVAKVAWAGSDASTKGEATFTNLQSSMGVNSFAPKSEIIVVQWDTKGVTADDQYGAASKEIRVLYNRQFGASFMSDFTGKGGMADEVGYVERRVSPTGAYYLKAVRETANGGSKVIDTVIGDIGADGQGTVATSESNAYVSPNVTSNKPSEMGLKVFNVDMNAGTAATGTQTAMDGTRFHLPPAVAPQKLDQMGGSGGTFASASAPDASGKAPPSQFMPPPPK